MDNSVLLIHVYNQDRSKKKLIPYKLEQGVDEFLSTVCRKFDIGADSSLKFVLDSDGCEIDPNDFLIVLRSDMSVVILKPSECWKEKVQECHSITKDTLLSRTNVSNEDINILQVTTPTTPSSDASNKQFSGFLKYDLDDLFFYVVRISRPIFLSYISC
ncbi:uncharacterized protein LOC124819058 [Hydra vulgaris]|uniref:uncharacterized protein LOC124819058 n=1 Tax=Hydra vulgaris TaxID=6087 RepID=UPI001F5ED11B|nr:uncharacterized protein LOC124819058 [Hydra vulgaris]